MLKQLKRVGIISGLSATLLLAACGGSDDSAEDTNTDDSSANGDVKYGEEMGYTITGIEPGAGVFKASENAVEEYGLEGWEVQASSSGAMATALGEAIDNEEPIIVTGWSPHWKFSEYDLKYLEDPKEVFGGEENIASMAKKGLEEEKPSAYKIIDNFNWTPDDIESVMLEVHNGVDPEEAAQAWVDENQDKVDEWTDGVEEVDGVEVELAYVEWDTEVASNNVLKLALESAGFNVTITPLDNAVMWEAVATGEVDAMIAAWLPGTHGDLYEQYKDELVDLGPNLEGAKIGLVVPSYMDIDSIEDLDTK